MKLNITKRQYKYLLEICLFGVYIIEESKIEVGDEYKELLKYILFLGEDPSFKIDENILEGINEVASTVIEHIEVKEDFISQYNERTFWKELAIRMAARDAIEELGDNITEENFSEYIKVKEKYEKKYIEKFNIQLYNNKELPY